MPHELTEESMTDNHSTAGLIINIKTGEVSNTTQKRRLSPINARVLAVLLQQAGKAVSRQQIFEAVWPNQVVSDDALTRSVSDLRAQLKPMTATEPLIETIPKVGYRWLPPVNENTKATQITTHSSIVQQHLISIMLALGLLFVLVWALLYWLQKDPSSNFNSLVVIENPATQTLGISDCLKQAIVKHENLGYLSDHAINTHQGNPYPYFSNQFGVHWFIEHQLLTYRGVEQINFSLIDAKTGLVVFEQRYHLIPEEPTRWCQTFINQVNEFKK